MLVLNVRGMTCDHCVRAVTEAVREAAPGAEVAVDLRAGTVAVAGSADPARVAAAIAEAGYEAAR